MISQDGCSLSPARVADGPAVFSISNSDAADVNEVGVARDGVVLAEDESVGVGLSGSIVLDLSSGSYQVLCPRSSGPTTTAALTVVHTAKPPLTPAQQQLDTALDTAVSGYRTYLEQQTALLSADVRALSAAIARGDLSGARAAYATARSPYERVEPVAEAFPDLDEQIDARPQDLAPGIHLAGFHRVEEGLWASSSTAGLAVYADQLVADCAILQSRAETITLQPAQLSNGASALLDEIGKSKITGEEEHWSHLDLVDLRANLDGAAEAYDLLRPALLLSHASLVAQVDQQLVATRAVIARFAGVTSYATVSDADRRTISAAVDALAAPIAEIGGALVS